jgi:hypothetical protein
MCCSRRDLLKGVAGLAVAGGLALRQAEPALAQPVQGVPGVLVRLVYPGWSRWETALGSAIYTPVAKDFQVSLELRGLRVLNPYRAVAQAVSFNATNKPAVTQDFSTDGSGSARLNLTIPNSDLTVSDMSKDLPVYQVHILILDVAESLSDLPSDKRPPAVLSLQNGVSLACEYPLGFALQS